MSKQAMARRLVELGDKRSVNTLRQMPVEALEALLAGDAPDRSRVVDEWNRVEAENLVQALPVEECVVVSSDRELYAAALVGPMATVVPVVVQEPRVVEYALPMLAGFTVVAMLVMVAMWVVG